jgi:hypothetical protein
VLISLGLALLTLITLLSKVILLVAGTTEIEKVKLPQTPRDSVQAKEKVYEDANV